MLVFAYKCSHKSLQTSQDKLGPLACTAPAPEPLLRVSLRRSRLPALLRRAAGRGLISPRTLLLPAATEATGIRLLPYKTKEWDKSFSPTQELAREIPKR